jgi:hypothetical protein
MSASTGDEHKNKKRKSAEPAAAVVAAAAAAAAAYKRCSQCGVRINEGALGWYCDAECFRIYHVGSTNSRWAKTPRSSRGSSDLSTSLEVQATLR